MTNEEKVTAYDEALRKAKKLYEQGTITESLSYVFPELAESEDEMIRKELIDFVDISILSIDERHDRWIAWLEKQGETSPIHSNSSNIGKDEQQPEPKFKVGDWVKHNVTKEAFIIKGMGNTYCMEDIAGMTENNPTDIVDELSTIWTIQDARDGDVLYSLDSNQPFIYKSRKAHEQAIAYCGINKYGNFFVWNTKDCIITLDKYIPATKEQRDLLFQKMKVAGYEWDFVKKELKKIEQKK